MTYVSLPARVLTSTLARNDWNANKVTKQVSNRRSVIVRFLLKIIYSKMIEILFNRGCIPFITYVLI